MKPRQQGRIGLFFALVGVIILLLAAGGATVVVGSLQLGAVGPGSPVPVTVSTGESLTQVADSLQNKGLIQSAFFFSAYARLHGVKLRAGEYQLNSGMTTPQIISALEAAPSCPPDPSVKLVVPEGFTVDRIADRVSSIPGLDVTRQQYLAAVAQDSYAAPFLSIRPAGDSSLEGFLFPATYPVPDCASAHDVVQAQLSGFAEDVPTLPSSATQAYADLIIASIVQSEAGTGPNDPADVASVIDNRLAQGMRLQVDATVMYGLHMAGQPMSAADEAVDTPYNTYLHSGLPPTPISNPGLVAIKAALHPASTNYLFYFSDACGHDYYSATYAQFQQLESEYLGKCPSPTPTPAG